MRIGTGRAQAIRPASIETNEADEAIELLRAVGDELDITYGVTRGPLRALAALPEAVVAIVGALTPGEPNALISFDTGGLMRLAEVGRAARGEATPRRPTLGISPTGYADLLRAIGLFARENGWDDLRLLPFAYGLALYHDSGHEAVLGEQRLREIINGSYRRRATVEPVAEDMSPTRRAMLHPLEPRPIEPRSYSYAAALAALGAQLASRTRKGQEVYPLIADVADGFALVVNAPGGRQCAEVVMAADLAEYTRRRRGVRRPASTALQEGLRSAGAYLDRVHAREALIQRRPATPRTPGGSFTLAFSALSGSSGVMGSFDRRLIPVYTPGTADHEVEELWGQ